LSILIHYEHYSTSYEKNLWTYCYVFDYFWFYLINLFTFSLDFIQSWGSLYIALIRDRNLHSLPPTVCTINTGCRFTYLYPPKILHNLTYSSWYPQGDKKLSKFLSSLSTTILLLVLLLLSSNILPNWWDQKVEIRILGYCFT